MKLILKMAVVALLVTAIFSLCGEPYFFSDSRLSDRCIHSCQDPSFDNCPSTIHAPWAMPLYCGLQINNQWANFTFACQICNTDAIGFFSGPCTCDTISCPPNFYCEGGNCYQKPVDPEPTCQTEGCDPGFQCIQGECVQEPPIPPVQCYQDSQCGQWKVCDSGFCRDQTCADITCSDPLDTCEYGMCFRKYDPFCSVPQPKIQRHYCRFIRPSQQNCPSWPYPYPSSDQVCAVATNGDKIGFWSICEACKRSFVEYVYTQPCSQIPTECSDEQACVDGHCVAMDMCAGITCDDGFVCNNGICIPEQTDLCAYVRCEYGYICHNGYCVPISTGCVHDSQCPWGHKCHYGKCVAQTPIDKCAAVTCLQGYKCVDGHCIPISTGCTYDSQCPWGHKCHYGKCVSSSPIDKCAYVLCQKGYKCVDGNCIPISTGCVHDSQCDWGQKCHYGQCVSSGGHNKCDHVVCPLNHQCKDGKCVKVCNCPYGHDCDNWGNCKPIDQCAWVVCPPGKKCLDGQCQEICHCQYGYQCNSHYQCVPVDKCANIVCPYGYKCHQGHCVQVNGHWHDYSVDPQPEPIYPQPNPYYPQPGYPSNGGHGDHCSTNTDCSKQCVCVGYICQIMECQYDWQCYGSPCKYGKCFNKEKHY